MKLVIPDRIDLTDEWRKKLEEHTSSIYDDVNNDPKVIIERIKDAEIVTANFIDLTREIIEQCPKLRYVIVPAVGYDWVDKKACDERGIKIINCPTHNSNAVAEHAIALIFAFTENLLLHTI